MRGLLTLPVAVALAGIWVILFGLAATDEVLDLAFGSAITFIAFLNSDLT